MTTSKYEEKKVNVLGTSYNLIFDNESITDNYGLCERYSKEIFIYLQSFTGNGTCKNVEKVIEKTIRHELLHAIFHEAGLDEYCEDETLIDCLAILYPKIQEIMSVVETMENNYE